MELIELAGLENMSCHVMVDWQAPVHVERNLVLLKKMTKGRSRQSDHSRKRQAFITGMAVYRMGGDELAAKRLYLEEWHIRISENE